MGKKVSYIPPLPPEPTDNLVQFWCNTKAKYIEIEEKDPAMIYLCKDTREVFKGDDLYSGSARIVSTLPLVVRKNTLYIIPSGDNAGGYVYGEEETGWKKVIQGCVVTGKAITLDDIPVATETKDGLLCCTDKVKYDTASTTVSVIEESYPVAVQSQVTPEVVHYTITQGESQVGVIDVPTEGGSIPIASEDVAGKVKASSEVSVLSDGTMAVGTISTQKVEGLPEVVESVETISQSITWTSL